MIILRDQCRQLALPKAGLNPHTPDQEAHFHPTYFNKSTEIRRKLVQKQNKNQSKRIKEITWLSLYLSKILQVRVDR